MAGLCEACSHVGAILFAVEAGVRMRDSSTCTQKKGKWIMPGYVKEIPYLPVSEMDFTSAKKKHSLLLEEQVTPMTARTASDATHTTHVPVPTTEEQIKFFSSISGSTLKPAILSVVQPFNEQFTMKENDTLPKPLPESLYKEECIQLEYKDLLQCCQVISLNVSPDGCQAVEAATRTQSNTKVWFQQRAGRITASNLKSACRTNASKPSKSLIKTICYPEAHKFSSAATRWGSGNESRARDAYQRNISQFHESLTISDSGLHVNPKWPHLGTSPDGMVDCNCCGSGVCEIKCPFTFKDAKICDAAGQKNFCLKKDEDGNICLDTHHAYYFQVQAQIFICGVEYCDFVVWTTKDLFVQRILPDLEFWENAVCTTLELFNKCVLPELVGKWFTRPGCEAQAHPSCTSTDAEDDEEGPWCYCQRHLEGSTLIGCDNEACKVKWYHMSCLRMKEEPEGEWVCPTCHRLQ